MADIKDCLRDLQRAKARRQSYESTWDEIYDFVMPNRLRFTGESSEGQRRDEKVFDDTAINANVEFANRLQQGLCPSWSNWMRLEPGSEVPRSQLLAAGRMLEAITEKVFDELEQSNFSTQVNENFQDLGLGFGILHMDDTPDGWQFCSVPQRHVYLGEGVYAAPDTLIRATDVQADLITTRWPQAKISEELRDLIRDHPDALVRVYERQRRIHGEREPVYEYVVWVGDSDAAAQGTPTISVAGQDARARVNSPGILWERRFVGQGSAPLMAFRFSGLVGELYGRGPAYQALPTVKSLNLQMQLEFELLDQAVGGVWQAEDDGVVNPDNVSFRPGAVNLYAQGGKGFSPMVPETRMDLTEKKLQEQRQQIRKAFYNETLGPRVGTPPSATEIAERMADLARQLGPVLDRLILECLIPVFMRGVHLLKARGAIELPKIDGKLIKLSAESPLANARKQQNIIKVTRFAENVGGIFGPMGLQMALKQESAIEYLARQWEVPADLVRTPDEMKALTAQLAQAAQGAAAQGADPQAIAKEAAAAVTPTQAGPSIPTG